MKSSSNCGVSTDEMPPAIERLKRFWQIFLLLVAMSGSGCEHLKATLALRSQIAFKVQGAESSIPVGGVASTNGWTFIHLAACRYDKRTEDGAIVEDQPAQWYLAVRSDMDKPEAIPWLSIKAQYAKTRTLLPQIADAAKLQFGIFPTTLEVVNVFDSSTYKGPKTTNIMSRVGPTNAPVLLQRGARPHYSWPVGESNGTTDAVWHLRANYSQIEQARERVTTNHAQGPWKVRVGIIDTGFSGAHVARPKFIEEDDERADAWNWISCRIPDSKRSFCPILKPSVTEGSHGTGTIGILAGSEVVIPPDETGGGGYIGPLGGVPEATIVPVRVAPWVVSINTANFAYAIDYASRVMKCDVISMSHGGTPSLLWYDTINSAYWRGTAMIAATGDFVSFGPFRRAIVPIPPSSPVYPAAARRVLGVTGVTARSDSYAGPAWGGFLNGMAHLKPFDASIRGSYGADGSWRNLLFGDEKGDSVALKRSGELRIHPIAAWSPNVPWLVAQSKADGRDNVVDMDGGGTSAATPQVAAAAALWLERYKEQWAHLPPEQRWKKAEATYQVLLRTAHRSPNAPTWPDKYLGSGFLKANDALERSFEEIVHAGPEPGFSAFDRSPRDFFDGDKTLMTFLDRALGLFRPDGKLSNKIETKLALPPHPDTLRAEALSRCFYNTRLLEAWHLGKNPDSADCKQLEAIARKDALTALTAREKL